MVDIILDLYELSRPHNSDRNWERINFLEVVFLCLILGLTCIQQGSVLVVGIGKGSKCCTFVDSYSLTYFRWRTDFRG